MGDFFHFNANAHNSTQHNILCGAFKRSVGNCAKSKRLNVLELGLGSLPMKKVGACHLSRR